VLLYTATAKHTQVQITHTRYAIDSTVVNQIHHMISSLRIVIYGVIDDLYQKSASFSFVHTFYSINYGIQDCIASVVHYSS
jgi:hypothetical protein